MLYYFKSLLLTKPAEQKLNKYIQKCEIFLQFKTAVFYVNIC